MAGSGLHGCQSRANEASWPKHPLFSPLLGPCSLSWLQPSLVQHWALPSPIFPCGSRDCTFLPGQWQAGLCLLPPSPEGSSACQGLQRFRIQSSAKHHSAWHSGVHRACQQQPCSNQKMNMSQKAKPEQPISKMSLFTLGLNFMF